MFILGRPTKYTKLLKPIIGKGAYIVGFTDPAPFLLKSSVIIHPALYDAFSIAVIEAMLAGCIPVTTNRVGASELFVNDPFLKDLVCKIDPEIIAQKVVSLLKSPLNVKLRISQHAKRIALNPALIAPYSIKQFKNTFNELLTLANGS